MPVCHTCGRYFTPHARQCPACYDEHGQPKMIRSAVSLPSIGDTYVDPEVGDCQLITGLHWAGALLVLDLEDGSHVEVVPAELRPAASAPEIQSEASLACTAQISP